MKIKTTSIFWNNYNSEKKININRWGTRSWKTYILLLLFLFWLLFWKIDKNRYFKTWVLTMVRKFSSNLKNSTQRDFENIIDSYWKRGEIEINKTDRTYKYGWRMVEFMWADDQQKLRWTTRDILYCNEANELWYNTEFFQLLMRTKYKIFKDYNPDDEYIWINTELEQKRRIEEKDVRVIISTYRDNPFLPIEQVKEIERLENSDPQMWKIYWLWHYGKLEWLIFQITEIKAIPKEAKFVCYWLDFWFTNDPTALIAIYKSWDSLIFDELIYQTSLTNQDIINKLKWLWIKRPDEIFWDSSEPKSIEEIYRGGFNIKSVTKGADSIKYWIDILKNHNLVITEKSYNLRKEFKKYSWKLDKNWKALNAPIDEYNHWIDALRYGVMMKLWNKKKPTLFIG